MAKFIYKAKKGLKETIEGVIQAESRDAAVARLTADGLIPISVELEAASKEARVPSELPVSRRGRLGLKELVIFTQQLRTLIRSKVELLSSLSMLYRQSENPALKSIIYDLQNTVKDGKTFSEGLSKYPGFFPLLYVNIVRAGEVSGRLDEALSQLSDFLEKEQDLRMKVSTALAYPLLMTMVGIGTVFVLFAFVIPRLAGIFEDFQAVLPLPTRILLKISAIMQHGWFFIIIFAAAVFFVVRRQNIASKNYLFDSVKISLPVLGELTRKQAIARFSHTLALLLHSGIPVFQSLRIAVPTLENSIYVKQLEPVHQKVIAGSTLADALREVEFMPQFIVQMIAVGEKGGRLEDVLNEIYHAYTLESDSILKIITSLIEPLVILCLGLVLGLVILAMLLPIFQINMLIK